MVIAVVITSRRERFLVNPSKWPTSTLINFRLKCYCCFLSSPPLPPAIGGLLQEKASTGSLNVIACPVQWQEHNTHIVLQRQSVCVFLERNGTYAWHAEHNNTQRNAKYISLEKCGGEACLAFYFGLVALSRLSRRRFCFIGKLAHGCVLLIVLAIKQAVIAVLILLYTVPKIKECSSTKHTHTHISRCIA